MRRVPSPAEKLERLEHLLRDMGSVVLAYSGGLDSGFLLAVASNVLGERAVALTAVSPTLPAAEREQAVRLAQRLGARHLLADSRELEDPRFAENRPDRCYHCKNELFRLAGEKQKQLGFAHIADGATPDDMGDYRPGLQAASDAGVRHPLIEADLSKSEIRELARGMNLEFWDKPASACLASRIPYGTPVTAERLLKIEKMEAALGEMGLHQVRVRFHGDTARIEVSVDEMGKAFGLREGMVRAGKAVGFDFVALDLEGYRTGSLNEPLKR
jgi:uncharacterized protein